MKAHGLDRRREKVREELEADDQETYDIIEEKLGDFASTELGQSAVTRAKGKGGKAGGKGGAQLDGLKQ
jgi:hypothetical protein